MGSADRSGAKTLILSHSSVTRLVNKPYLTNQMKIRNMWRRNLIIFSGNSMKRKSR